MFKEFSGYLVNINNITFIRQDSTGMCVLYFGSGDRTRLSIDESLEEVKLILEGANDL